MSIINGYGKNYRGLPKKTCMKKIKLWLLLVVLLLGCASKEDVADKVVLKAGSLTFTMHDLDIHLSRFNYKNPDDEFFKKKDFLEQHLNKLLIAEAGLEIGLGDSVEVDSAQVARILFEIVYKREVTDRLEITDRDVRKYWEKYGGEIHAFQILVNTEELADSLYDILHDNAELFSDLAAEFSVDSLTNFKGGDIGYVQVGQMLDEFQEAAFQLKQNEVSKPVHTAYGWHIIKVTDRRNHTEEDFEKEKGRYRGMYSYSQREKIQKELSKKLKDMLNYKYYDETLQMLIDKAKIYKNASADKSRDLNHYISLSKLTDEEAAQPLVTIDSLTYSAGKFIQDLDKYFRTSGLDFSNSGLAEEAIENFMAIRLMYAYALSKGLKNDPEFKRQYEDTRLGFVYRKMESEYIHASIDVTDEEIEKYYEKRKDMFTEPMQIRASEILLRTEEEAEQILSQLRKGESFSKLVKKTIRPGFAETEGNLGYFGPSRNRAIYDAALNVKVDEYGGPVKVQDNWAVFKVTGRKPMRKKELSEVRSQIKNRLTGSNKYQNLQQWLEDRKQKVEHFIDLELVKANLVTGKLND